VNVLLLAARPPLPPHTGDRLRLGIWIEALRGRANGLVAVPGGAAIEGVTVIRARLSIASFIAAAIRVAKEGLPLHTLISAPWNWDAAIAAAGPVDVAVVLLSRTYVWVAPSLRDTPVVLDAIDSLAANAEERARSSRGIARIFWKFEAKRMLPLEKKLAARATAVVTVSENETAIFGAKTTAIPIGVELHDVEETGRDFDAGFWGRLAYFANEDAVRQLVDVVWPRLLSLRPHSTLLIAGSEAPTWVRRLDGTRGITVLSPMTDRPRLLRRVKIALFPLRFGTGQSTKTLEAAEASCTVVGTPLAFRALPRLAAEGVVESDVAKLADRAAELLADGERLTRTGKRMREIVAREHNIGRCREELANVVTQVAVR